MYNGVNLLVLPSDHIYDGDFDIQKYWNFHRESAADITLMTVPNKSYGEYLNVDSDNVLSVEKSIGEGSVSYMFSNKFLMGVLHRMRRNAFNELNIYKDIVCPSIGRAAVNHFFIGQDQGYWEDTGTLERYLKSNMRLSDGHNVVSARAQVDDSVDLRRSVVLGNARVEGSVHIEDAIISSNYKGELLISGIDS